jgi:polar amino acid transport system substrate-binding protein
MTALRHVVLGVVILGWVLSMLLSALAAGPDVPTPDRELVLGLRTAPPFAMKASDGIWTGITVELWRHMAEQLGLRYRFEETTAEELFHGLVDGRLDASAGALTVTGERLREVDFSLPYLVTGLGVAAPRQAPLNWIGIAASFLTFRFLSIVLGILGLLMLVSLILWLLERRHTEYFGGPPVDGLICSITWSAQAMSRANPPSRSPTTRFGRLMGAAWTTAAVALIAMFTAAITSHLTARELSGLVRDEADLHHVRVGTVGDAVAVSYLDRESIHHRDFATIEDVLRALAADELDAVVYDKPRLAWLIRQEYPNELQILDLSLDPQSYAIARPFGSPLRQKLNIALVERTRAPWWRELVGRYLGFE